MMSCHRTRSALTNRARGSTSTWRGCCPEFVRTRDSEMIDQLRMSGGTRRDWHHVLLLPPPRLQHLRNPCYVNCYPAPARAHVPHRRRSPFNIAPAARGLIIASDETPRGLLVRQIFIPARSRIALTLIKLSHAFDVHAFIRLSTRRRILEQSACCDISTIRHRTGRFSHPTRPIM